MTSRAMVYLGLTVALAACSKNSQETDALAPPPKSTKPASDTTQVRMERPDTSQYGKDSVKVKADSGK